MHGGLQQEIKYLTDFGASPQLRYGPHSQAAMVCGMENEIGTLEAGKAPTS